MFRERCDHWIESCGNCHHLGSGVPLDCGLSSLGIWQPQHHRFGPLKEVVDTGHVDNADRLGQPGWLAAVWAHCGSNVAFLRFLRTVDRKCLKNSHFGGVSELHDG